MSQHPESKHPKNVDETPRDADNSTPAAEDSEDRKKRPREVGGRKGPDPTRYGDWEKNGRCIDF